eukprot:TRINITY_DN75283_c0_g1_i1.p1 TRINITY_DN75283_c0_g1~~TRINITY_DN75283_c0_g1_i1.p1  ORF type:complete len:448 (-),score=66.03 TRINITY_DN75283_c0_g1_i1:23-1174(-)
MAVSLSSADSRLEGGNVAGQVLLGGVYVPYPMLGLGCSSGIRYEHVQTAIQNGYRLFDTAQAYVWGYHEDEVGNAVADSGLDREEFYLQTKIHPEDLGYQATLRAFNMSLQRLRSDYVDSLLLHKPRCWEGACQKTPEGTWQDSWRALEELYDKKLVRAIGICDVDQAIFAELMHQRIKPHVIQNWVDPFHQDRDMRRLCKDNGVVFQGYSTMGPQWVHFKGFSTNPVLTSPVVLAIAEKHRRSPSQVVLRWATQRGVAVIPASRNSGRQIENFNSLDFDLIEEDLQAIDDMDGRVPQAPHRVDTQPTVTFVNYLQDTVEAYWVNGKQKVQVGSVGAGGRDLSISTHVGHQFVFESPNKQIVGSFTVADGQTKQRHELRSDEL